MRGFDMTTPDMNGQLKLILFSLAEAVERQIQPNECSFELSDDQTKYQLRVTGGKPGIIAWATNDPGWRKFEPGNSKNGHNLIINIPEDFLTWDLWEGPLKWLYNDKFSNAWSLQRPAINYVPKGYDYGELSFELVPTGIATGAGSVKTEPMAGYGLVLSVLVIAANKSLRKRLDKRTREYRWLKTRSNPENDSR
jgi:hypothetical protein